jgi:predicted nuclease of predicted toxin-antitoxin system
VRVKLDENLPHDLAAALRRDGHDVHTVVEEQLAGESDPVVVAAATGEGRILLTLDRGIGDLRRYPPGSHAGIVVLRPAAQDPDSILSLIQRLMRTHPLGDPS